MFGIRELGESEAKKIPVRLLAHLGDAVFNLYEREREILKAKTANQMHNKVLARVKATAQAELLDAIAIDLTHWEAEIVRRARNLRPSGYRKTSQGTYRKATAFEALIGYLYLTNKLRLNELLKGTVSKDMVDLPAPDNP